MSDDIDRGCEREQLDREAAIARARRARPRLAACGKCLNCNEALPDGIRFCDAECRDQFEYRARRARDNGQR